MVTSKMDTINALFRGAGSDDDSAEWKVMSDERAASGEL
jgi:hypothetical protein